MRARLPASALCLALAALSAAGLAAPAPKPRGSFNAVQPPYVEPGKTLTIQFYGRDLSGSEVRFENPAIQARLLRTAAYAGKTDAEKQRGNTVVEVEVTLPADLKPGSYPCRLVGEAGSVTGSVTVDVPAPEIQEVEPNDSLDKPQVLPPGNLNVLGTLNHEGVDVFQIQGKAGETWRFEIWSQRLTPPATLDPVIRLRDAHRTPLKLAVSHGKDCSIQYTLPADGPYLIELFDAENRADDKFKYRLAIRKL